MSAYTRGSCQPKSVVVLESLDILLTGVARLALKYRSTSANFAVFYWSLCLHFELWRGESWVSRTSWPIFRLVLTWSRSYRTTLANFVQELANFQPFRDRRQFIVFLERLSPSNALLKKTSVGRSLLSVWDIQIGSILLRNCSSTSALCCWFDCDEIMMTL